MNTLINPNSEWIMDCPTPKVAAICRNFLTIIDDLQQEADEEFSAELEFSYNRLEHFARFYSYCKTATAKYRNEIRIICKDILRISTLSTC